LHFFESASQYYCADKNNGRFKKHFCWNHTTAGLPLRARSEKIVLSCMQQLIEPDTFSQMKIMQRYSLPDRKYY